MFHSSECGRKDKIYLLIQIEFETFVINFLGLAPQKGIILS